MTIYGVKENGDFTGKYLTVVSDSPLKIKESHYRGPSTTQPVTCHIGHAPLHLLSCLHRHHRCFHGTVLCGKEPKSFEDHLAAEAICREMQRQLEAT
ncbi:hypothetical protein RLOC_00015123, partial [Lonchura striata]